MRRLKSKGGGGEEGKRWKRGARAVDKLFGLGGKRGKYERLMMISTSEFVLLSWLAL